ncbi:DEKNAAC105420 [Brettanomyces naardenensis]|uniref:DEKNAAC105420 n=1 Tax=Brettanomyces naardenensis TaxID=13370 RepID=A0A448YTA8_BRENA|nr:DEKNAAC105420 [Brettanomyces naardenensis]
MKVTNTIIITDERQLANDDLLNELLRSIRSLLPEGKKMQVSLLKFFNRVVIVFEDHECSQKIHDVLKEYGIMCDYSLRDNDFTENDDIATDNNRLHTEEAEERWPINSEWPEKPERSRVLGRRLEVPVATIQLKSPPTSPYLGWENEPEDPPDELSMTDPKSLAKILYEPVGDDEEIRERVFKEVDEGDEEKEEDVPILLIGREEAEHLREMSDELTSARIDGHSESVGKATVKVEALPE